MYVLSPALASENKIKILSLPLMPEIVMVCAPVNAVPPVFNKDQLEPAATVPHFKPVAVELSAVRTVSLAPTANLATVSAAVAAIISPLASTMVGEIADEPVILLSICVWIAEVTPSTYPSSVAVILHLVLYLRWLGLLLYSFGISLQDRSSSDQ
jgi:hypothetical protein